MYRFIFGKNELFLVSSQRLLFFFVFFLLLSFIFPPLRGLVVATLNSPPGWKHSFEGCLWVLVTF